MKHSIILSALILLISGCFYPDNEPFPISYTKYQPVFMSRNALNNSIEVRAPRAIEKTGKIYIWEDVLFVNEPFKGIHVFDNTNTENPLPLGFIKIVGNIDISVKDGYLMADNATDLVSININDINNVTVASRKQNVFPEPTPPDLFAVPDLFSKSQRPDSLIIIDWEL